MMWVTVSAPCAWAAAVICYALWRHTRAELDMATRSFQDRTLELRELRAYVDGLAVWRER